MADESKYDEWIASRKAGEPSPDLTDRVMAALEEQNRQRKQSVHLADRMNRSRLARWSACLAALLVGISPFLFVAYVAQWPVF